ncbi:hypothetical protein M758_2G137300 [Ceratodon purpureus]|nr:hypothetical protein M758_2G137300 [Ceratodon purpureus]
MEAMMAMTHGSAVHSFRAAGDLSVGSSNPSITNYLSTQLCGSETRASRKPIILSSSIIRPSFCNGKEALGCTSSVRICSKSPRGWSTRRERARVEVRASVAAEQMTGSGDGESSDGERSRSETGVVIVGAGLAGLAAARQCVEDGIPFLLVEGSDGVGGRVRTDSYQGFLLDRGFQIFITAYPEAQAVLDYEALNLQTFYAGALVWFNGAFHRVADPLRHFTDGLGSLFNPIGSAVDKVIVGIVRLRAAVKPVSEILSADETTILSRLKSEGFSEAMIDRFFRPFFGGIFFDRELQTTSRLFEFVFKCLALGSNTLPAAGIGAIPQQMADKLPRGSVMLNSRVAKLETDDNGVISGVVMESGGVVSAKYGVVIAAEGPEAARLLGKKLPASPSVEKPPRSTTCLYFSADSSPVSEPILLLNGTKSGIINNMFFPTTVAPSYAPAGKTLVSVTLIGQYEKTPDSELEQTVRAELHSWFGAKVVDSWQHLRTYRIPLAQPHQAPPTMLQKEPRVEQGVYVCGDHRYSSTFDGALVSGRRAVQELMADCKLTASK